MLNDLMIKNPDYQKDQALELVSVIIPCYNSGYTIEQAVASVKAQTWPQVEIIVIDDGSTDPATITTLATLSDIRLVRQKNAGLPVARNMGFAAAMGDFLLPLDADDWLEPNAIEQLLFALKADNRAAYSYSYMQLEGEAKGCLIKSYNFFEQLFFNQMPFCLLLRRSIVSTLGGYDESMRQGYEDWEFNIRLGAHGLFGCVVPKPLLHYRVSSKGMLISQSNRLHGVLWGLIQEKHANLYRMSQLISLWLYWSHRPSTYPLFLYFVWITAYRLLPEAWFSALFRWLRNYSHSRRITLQNS
jgi:glycosyltransferase involved in cell wall biosynthesis